MERLNDSIDNSLYNSKGIFLSMSKFIYFLIIMYMGWFQWVFTGIPILSLILGTSMIICLIFHSIISKRTILSGVTIELVIWSVFVFFALASGMLVAIDIGYVVNTTVFFSQFIVLIFSINFITRQDGKLDFFIYSYIIMALVSAFTTVFWGVYMYSNRISMSNSMNPNQTAITMVVGTFCILIKLNFNNKRYSIMGFGTILLFGYVILLTASRNALLSLIVLISFWLVFSFKDLIRLARRKKLLNSIFLIILLISSLHMTFTYYSQSNMFARLNSIADRGAEDTRTLLIRSGIELFKERPLFGYGLNNYRTIIGTHSHNTFIEILVSTGIVGSILYFLPYIIIIFKVYKIAKSNTANSIVSKDAKLLLGLILALLSLGTGIVHFQNFYAMISLGLLIAFGNLHFNKTKNR